MLIWIILIIFFSLVLVLWIRHESYFDPRDGMAVTLFAVTAAMTVFTGYSVNAARDAVQVSRDLLSTEAGPNISLSDVELEYIDLTETPVRVTSWVRGPISGNHNSLNSKSLSRVALGMRFKNTGKDAGYIHLVGITSGNTRLELLDTNGESHFKVYNLVPAEGETGPLYSVDILKIATSMQKNESFPLDFKFEALNKRNEIDHIFFVALTCKKIVSTTYASFQIYCTPSFSK